MSLVLMRALGAVVGSELIGRTAKLGPIGSESTKVSVHTVAGRNTLPIRESAGLLEIRPKAAFSRVL